MKESTKNNRLKKEERRSNKAAKKAKNTKVEKKTNPNNLLIFLLIVLVVGGVFGGMFGYKWFRKDASIQKYLNKEENASMKEMQMDEYTTLKLSAKKNDMKMQFIVDTSDASKDELNSMEEYYKSEDAQDYIKYMASMYLINMKESTRALKPTIKYSIKLGDKVIKTEKLTYRMAKKFIKEQQKSAEETQETEPVEQTQEIEIDPDDLEGNNVIEVTPDTSEETNE